MMKADKAFFVGVTGALVVTVMAAVARLFFAGVAFELWLGSMFTRTIGPGTWMLGLVVHLLLGGLFGLVYAYVFELWKWAASGPLGLGFGAVHAVFAGLAIGSLPAMHPAMPGVVPSPGLFVVEQGIGGVLLFIGLHLVFGGFFGTVYGRLATMSGGPQTADARGC